MKNNMLMKEELVNGLEVSGTEMGWLNLNGLGMSIGYTPGCQCIPGLYAKVVAAATTKVEHMAAQGIFTQGWLLCV